jgi:octaprenyl-diphosphate synthase
MEQFLDRFNPHFEAIEAELGRLLENRPSPVTEIAGYALLGQGKRIRPLLFVLSSKLCGFQEQGMYRFSTIFELLHTASLLHDDVLDHAELRRKKPSVPQVWGNPAAVLGGDYLYSLATVIATEFENLAIIRTLSENMNQMVEGQFLELSHTHDWRITRNDYLEIITSKTAVLIASACSSGAIMAGLGEKEVEHFGQFGLNLGIAFQLTDDALDYTASEEEFGKPVGKDLKEGKITLPLIYYLSEKTKAEVDELQDLFKTHQAGEEDYHRLIGLVREQGVIEKVQREAEGYVKRASSFLDSLPESPARKDLLGLGRYIITRRH